MLEFLERWNAPHWLRCLCVLGKYTAITWSCWFVLSMLLRRMQLEAAPYEYLAVLATTFFTWAALSGAPEGEKKLFRPPVITIYRGRKVRPISEGRAQSRE